MFISAIHVLRVWIVQTVRTYSVSQRIRLYILIESYTKPLIVLTLLVFASERVPFLYLYWSVFCIWYLVGLSSSRALLYVRPAMVSSVSSWSSRLRALRCVFTHLVLDICVEGKVFHDFRVFCSSRWGLNSYLSACVQVIVSGKLRAQRAKSMKFTQGYMIKSGHAQQGR